MKKKTPENTQSVSKLCLIPLAFAIAIVPLVSLLHQYETDLSDYPWFSSNRTYVDAFLYFKGVFMQIAGAAAVVVLAYLIPKKDHTFLSEKRTLPPVIAMGIFAIMTVASALLSEHKKDAFFGGHEQFEGCFVLLSYMACFFLAFGYARTVRLIRFLLDALLIGAFIMGTLGTFQTFGMDWASSDWAKSLLALGLGKKVSVSQINVTAMGDNRTAYATLYNPNYIGSYVPLVLPFIIYIVVRGPKLWRRILAGITTPLLVITLWSSNSAAGKVASAAAVVMAVILILPLLKKITRIIAGAFGVAAFAAIAVIFFSTGEMVHFIPEEEHHNIDYMKNEDNSVLIVTETGKKIRATLDPAKMLADPLWSQNYLPADMLTITDDKTGAPIEVAYDEYNRPYINNPDYPAFLFYFEPRVITADQSADGREHTFSLLHVHDSGYDWTFLTPDGKELKYFDDYLGHLNDLRNVKTWGFDGYYRMLSGRGYIFAHTIPLLSNCIITGYGPDNFTYAYPNDDYVDKKYWGYNNQTTTRPHNTYLQIWVQEGMLAMLAYVFLFVLFLIRVFRLCYGRNSIRRNTAATQDIMEGENEQTADKNKATVRERSDEIFILRDFAVVAAIGTTAYMVAGLANDSVVGVSCIYWVMLGAGYAAEAMCRNLDKSVRGLGKKKRGHTV